MPLPPLTYDFVSPSRVVFGWGQREKVGELARTLGRRALIVSGSRTLERNGRIAAICQSLEAAGVEPLHVGRAMREPMVADVDEMVSILRDLRARPGDMMLAVGGGSAIDLAKAAGALATNEPVTSVRDFLEGVGAGRKVVQPPLPLLAMPTTAGTGSESTKNAVISSDDPPFKKSLRSELMVPRIVLIDPGLAVDAGPEITAWTGMDALTQCIESFVSRRATPMSRLFAGEGIQLAMSSLAAACRTGTSRSAREGMAQAALFSGIALANSGLGMAHGVAAALGIHGDLPHGLACAVMLPAAVKANVQHGISEWNLKMLCCRLCCEMFDTAESVESIVNEVFRQDRHAERIIDRIERLLSELGIPRRLSDIGIRRSQIPAIVRDSRGNSMSGNPREISDEELTRILEGML
jgi:alcohol dehydrogenase class IV